MAKMKRESGYEWVKATVSDDGRCRLTYRVVGAKITGSDSIDDDVSGWSDDEIREVAGQMIDIPSQCRRDIEVVWN